MNTPEDITFCHWNPNGVVNKEPILKRFLAQHQVKYCGIAESHAHRNAHLSDSTWIWDPGFESRPTFDQPRPPGGIGVLVDRNIAHSIVHSDKHCMWTRVELQGNNPICVAECYFPHSSKTVEHTTAWKSIAAERVSRSWACTDHGRLQRSHW